MSDKELLEEEDQQQRKCTAQGSGGLLSVTVAVTAGFDYWIFILLQFWLFLFFT
jgi:hypothetical protein